MNLYLRVRISKGGIQMNYIERLKNIDDFFNNISIEEFEQKLEAAGILEIEPSSNYDMELSLSLRGIIDQSRNLIYISEKNELSNESHNSYEFSKDYSKAV